MNVSRFEFEAPPPADGDQRREGEDTSAAMRATPSGDEDDQSSEEPGDEPGYGHGV